MTMRPPLRGPQVLCLVGPTACGKTAVACRIAGLRRVETISCDSMQVYRGMGILTQAPTALERRRLRSHLTECVDPAIEYSAARFARSARRIAASALRSGRLPMVVGGTGLYLRALLDGLFEADGAGRDEALRQRLQAEHHEQGPGHLHARLAAVDPDAARRIHANDVRRLVRALEVYELTGKPISHLQPSRRGLRADHRILTVLLDRDREELYRRIDERVDRMLEDGLVRQVRRLRSRKLGRTASVALGLREIGSYLDGACSLQEAAELMRRNTRRYAKRQLSWFRHERDIVNLRVPAGETAARTAQRVVALMRAGGSSA
ncbi:MAG: tRNA dimethylallyltransferase [Candidatus Omnitrophica bacterium]|nr:tRNA dimethylallyltransferase [Candidatus Omnitrophota bacterium]